MRIAHIIPYSVSYPLKSHNGRYDWVRELALLQVAMGHDVTIYGGPNSFIEGITISNIGSDSKVARLNNIETFRLALSRSHDIYHSHFDSLHYEVARETKMPIVFTQHWWPSEETIRLAHNNPGNVWAVPPTNYMYDFDETVGIQSKGSIYHGINLKQFHTTGSVRTNRLLFVGRISPEKNLDLAIAAAKKAGYPLDIVGKITPKNQSYWDTLSKDVDGKNICYLGEKSPNELIELYSSAYGVLCPFEPTEAFGLVSIEAQACGAPVILKRGGSRKELTEEGTTGFLFDTEDEFVDAIHHLHTINSQDCVLFAQKFDIQTMANGYQSLYKSLVN